MSNKLDRRKTSFVIFVLTMIFFYLPLAVLVIYSFNNGKGMAWQGFSLRWYKELFRHSSNIWKTFYYSIFIMFATVKFKLGITTIFIAHTTFNIPYVLFIILSRLDEFDYSVVEAAYDLGATNRQTLTKVIIPMLLPAIVSAFLMALTLSFDDFVITFFVSGPGSSTLPLRIYSMIRLGVSPVVNALSVLLIAISILLTLSTKKLQKNFIK